MKRVIIGGTWAIIGGIGNLFVFNLVANNMVGQWCTPPGRFLTSVVEMSVMPVFIGSIILLFGGLTIMAIEYFRNDTP